MGKKQNKQNNFPRKKLGMIDNSDFKALITDEEFESIREGLQERIKVFVFDQNGTRRQIEDFDEQVDGHITACDVEKNEAEKFTLACAISILLQGRNLLAKCIGVEQRGMPNLGFGEKQKTKNPISEKHFGIWMGGAEADAPVVKALDKVLRTNTEGLRFRFYASAEKIIADLPNICGLFSVSNGDSSVESYIRHELKNSPDWDYMKAQSLILPPCVDCHFGVACSVIANEGALMQEGKWKVKAKDSAFSLDQSLPVLASHVRVPKKEVCVVVIDDSLEEVNGIYKILRGWMRIRLNVITDEGNLDTFVHPSILLLDENLKDWKMSTGGEIYQYLLQEQRIQGTIVASITGGLKPAFTERHFATKATIVKNFQHSLGFVQFMNGLIAEVERQ